MTRRELVERLEATVSNACAMSLGHPASDTIDEKVMIEELENRCHEAQLHAADIVPDLERMEARLKATISELPDSIGEAAWTHRVNTLKWRPDPIPMPRAIAVFVVLERIEIARSSCLYLLARARYEELRQGHACDCSARMEADFLHGDPSGPLRLLDSIGVPFAAMDHLWVCETCGQKWAQEEGHDDAGVHTSWRPAAADATQA